MENCGVVKINDPSIRKMNSIKESQGRPKLPEGGKDSESKQIMLYSINVRKTKKTILEPVLIKSI